MSFNSSHSIEMSNQGQPRVEEIPVVDLDLAGEAPMRLSSANPSRRKAKIYNFFEEEEKSFRCKTCRFLVAKEKNSSTGNLHKHLKMHEKVYQKLKKSEENTSVGQRTIQESFKSAPYSNEKLQELIVEHIILSNQPFTVVEEESFLKLILHGRPQATEIVKADAIKKRIENLFHSEREKLVAKMQLVPGKISVIVDGWKSVNRHSFHGIIVTWISQDWDFEEIVLDFDVLEGSHTGKSLALSLYKVLGDFKITSKLLGVTSDNAANMLTMVTELESLISTENPDFSANDHHIRCLAHILNLACQSSLSTLKSVSCTPFDGPLELDGDVSDDEDSIIQVPRSVYFKVRRALQKIRKCDQLSDQLRRFCDSFDVSYLEPMLDMRIRWNSTFDMLKRALHLKKPLEALMRESSALEIFTLEEAEWELVKEMVKFLEPFNRMTKLISVHCTPTLSLAAAIFVELYHHIEAYSAQGCCASDQIKEAANAAEKKLNDYYPKSDALIYVIGLILDPRCKLEWHRSVGYGHLVASFKKVIMDVWKKQYKPAERDNSPEPENLFDLQMKRARFDNKDELQKYLSELPVKSSAIPLGILSWWKDHSSTYPNLSKMARDYLAASAAGVPIEATFSMGTDLLTCKRRKLSPQTIRMCMCLKSWMTFTSKEEFRRKSSEMVAEKMCGTSE